MAAAVSKIMRLQDLVVVARKCRVVTRFRNTIGLPGRLSVRLQPNHPTDDPRGIGAAILDGPEYLYDGKQIMRAGLEDHFCGKLMGLPMGCDLCYTNHAEADQDDMDALLTVLGVAGVTYIMGVPGADDVMLGYQSTSFHDAVDRREALGLRPAPEFEQWLQAMGVMDEGYRLLPARGRVMQLVEGAGLG
jgi:ethanolamine ammonia-lyase large subunit